MRRYIIIYILLSSINSIWLIYGISISILKWIILSISIKIGMYPNNHYVINFYRKLSIIKVILISTIPKIWLIYLISDIYNEILLDNIKILSILSIISLIIGTINVISNIEIKSLLGSSSIITISLSLYLISLNINSYSIFYIETYCLFLIILLIGFQLYLKLIIIFIFYNLLGLPPLFGFIIKYQYLSIILLINIYLTILFYILLTISSYMYFRFIERIILLNNRFTIILLFSHIFLFLDLL